MNIKDISEIKRTLSAERNAISGVAGCYVNANGEIISKFYQSLGLLYEDEVEKYLSVFKHTLSGSVNRNLFNLSFPSGQVPDGEEYALLNAIKRSELKDKAVLDTFYSKVISSISSQDNYVILLTHNSYDIPFRSKDGENTEARDIYSYILCSICPVKNKKSGLAYNTEQKLFRGGHGDSSLSAPIMGFLFPAFDDRRTNINSLLFYTKSIKEAYPELTEALFKTGITMPAAEEAQTFRMVVAESLGDDCKFEVAKNVHSKLTEMIEIHKESKDKEPLTISEAEVKFLLEDCGVTKEKIEVFGKNFSSNFKEKSELSPKNIITAGRLEVKTPNVVIKVAPGHGDLIETRNIDGIDYILIRADEGVELNGLNVNP